MKTVERRATARLDCLDTLWRETVAAGADPPLALVGHPVAVAVVAGTGGDVALVGDAVGVAVLDRFADVLDAVIVAVCVGFALIGNVVAIAVRARPGSDVTDIRRPLGWQSALGSHSSGILFALQSLLPPQPGTSQAPPGRPQSTSHASSMPFALQSVVLTPARSQLSVTVSWLQSE